MLNEKRLLGIWGAQFSADGKRILSRTDEGTARLWDAADGKPVGNPMQQENGSVSGAQFSADVQAAPSMPVRELSLQPQSGTSSPPAGLR